MKRLLILALFGATAWYGWKHYDGLRNTGGNEATVVNQSSRALERLRLTAGTETVVIEHLEPDASATRTFRGGVDATFRLVWAYQGLMGEQQWSGGTSTSGPMRMRHTFLVDDQNSVIWNSEVLLPKK
ncbi:MAG: hypothetical protein ABIU54_12020 [Candidatus Eisenbacteria bacterium]